MSYSEEERNILNIKFMPNSVCKDTIFVRL